MLFLKLKKAGTAISINASKLLFEFLIGGHSRNFRSILFDYYSIFAYLAQSEKMWYKRDFVAALGRKKVPGY